MPHTCTTLTHFLGLKAAKPDSRASPAACPANKMGVLAVRVCWCVLACRRQLTIGLEVADAFRLASGCLEDSLICLISFVMCLIASSSLLFPISLNSAIKENLIVHNGRNIILSMYMTTLETGGSALPSPHHPSNPEPTSHSHGAFAVSKQLLVNLSGTRTGIALVSTDSVLDRQDQGQTSKHPNNHAQIASTQIAQAIQASTGLLVASCSIDTDLKCCVLGVYVRCMHPRSTAQRHSVSLRALSSLRDQRPDGIEREVVSAGQTQQES